MIIKEVNLGQEGRDRLIKGIKLGFDSISSTLGPKGQAVIIEDSNIVGGVKISRDGVSVVNSINLLDPIQDLGLKIVRESSRKSEMNSGDGSTTSFVLSYGLIKSANELITDGVNKTEVIRSIHALADKLDRELIRMSKKVNGKTLLNVATISGNNDISIGKLVASAYKDSDVVNLENSNSYSTYLEKFAGIKIDRGWSSKFFINNHKTNECIMDNCLILITDIEINNLQSIEPIIKASIDANKPLLIIGEMTPAVAATINLNVAKGNIRCCNIIPPAMGIRKENTLQDLAVATGGHFYSQMMGENFGLVTMEGLGKANRVIVGQDKTIVIPVENNSDAIKSHISELKDSIKLVNNEDEIKRINERIANISGSISTIYVGADTEIEKKEYYDLVEDAILAVKSAISEGVLPGGGVALFESIELLRKEEFNNENDKIAFDILYEAIKLPIRCIVENAGVDFQEVLLNLENNKSKRYGYNAKNNTYGDMYNMGIIDPTKVVRNSLKNSVSVATTIISTNCIISNIRE